MTTDAPFLVVVKPSDHDPRQYELVGKLGMLSAALQEKMIALMHTAIYQLTVDEDDTYDVPRLVYVQKHGTYKIGTQELLCWLDKQPLRTPATLMPREIQRMAYDAGCDQNITPMLVRNLVALYLNQYGPNIAFEFN